MNAKAMRKLARSDDANAFLREGKEDGAIRSSDSLAEHLGESFVRSALGGDDEEEIIQSEIAAEEDGGPFTETTEAEEFGATQEDKPGEDEEEVLREPFPTAIRGLRSDVGS
jgi:hypothetical protein